MEMEIQEVVFPNRSRKVVNSSHLRLLPWDQLLSQDVVSKELISHAGGASVADANQET